MTALYVVTLISLFAVGLLVLSAHISYRSYLASKNHEADENKHCDRLSDIRKFNDLTAKKLLTELNQNNRFQWYEYIALLAIFVIAVIITKSYL